MGWAHPRFRFRPESFPRLHSLRDKGDPETTKFNFTILPSFLPRMPGLKRIEVSSDDLFHVSSTSFPDLEEIVLQHNQGEFPTLRHANLRVLEFHDDAWPENLEKIRKERLPKI